MSFAYLAALKIIRDKPNKKKAFDFFSIMSERLLVCDFILENVTTVAFSCLPSAILIFKNLVPKPEQTRFH